MTLVSKTYLMKKYPLRPKATDEPKTPAKVYRMEPEDCYSIGDISQSSNLNLSFITQNNEKVDNNNRLDSLVCDKLFVY